MKKCGKCGKLKPKSEFYKNPSKKDGLNWHCKECHKIMRRQHYLDNRLKVWVQKTLWSHKDRGFKIEISKDELEALLIQTLEEGCFYCGKPFEFGSKKIFPYSPSLDIIDPEVKVVSKDNVRIIHNCCNAGKSNLSELEFIENCVKIANNHGYRII